LHSASRIRFEYLIKLTVSSKCSVEEYGKQITNQNYSQAYSGIVFQYPLFEFFPLQSDDIEEALNPILPLHHP
jgi:hypothetical protein